MNFLNTQTVLSRSALAFGTSGARGLVEDFNQEVCAAFTLAFISTMKDSFSFKRVAIGIDNRPSSPLIAKYCATALDSLGYQVIFCGVLPTPALANYSMNENIPAIMVTGSHIPFDRNGLKFYRPDGEITKEDEAGILSASEQFKLSPLVSLDETPVATDLYIKRYVSLFKNTVLNGKKIGIYEHSSSGRDCYEKIFRCLGAEVISLGRSDEFVPIDTEAVADEDKEKAKNWSKQFKLDAIFSTDGDGDRPLIADEEGCWLRGDVLGLLTSIALDIDALAVPISCNTAIEKSAQFNSVVRTKIGSPYVIAEFAELEKKYKSVAGFEANGGYLLGTDCKVNGQTLAALPTRDAVLPAIMLFANNNLQVSDLVNNLPSRYTASDRVKDFETATSKKIIEKYKSEPTELLRRLGFVNPEIIDVNTIDGLRLTLKNNEVIHLRPSGNAPEFRCYAESSSEFKAKEIVSKVLSNLELKFK